MFINLPPPAQRFITANVVVFKTMTQTGARTITLTALLCVGIALSACTALGTGNGALSPGGAPVTFAWTSTHAGMSGTMRATLANGETFTGPFLEASREVGNEDEDIFSESFERGWVEFGSDLPHWDGWGAYPNDLEAQYSGSVVVNLQAADGQRMRCRFQLDMPTEGLTGGGHGTCQLNNGRSVNAVFPPPP
jgi:hypothetical protein